MHKRFHPFSLIAKQPFFSRLNTVTQRWAHNATANGGTYSQNLLLAYDGFLKDLTTYSLRSKIQYALFCVGNNLSAAICPLIYDVGTSVAVNGGVTPLATFSQANGITGNSSGYLDFGFTDVQYGNGDLSKTIAIDIKTPNATGHTYCGVDNAASTSVNRISFVGGANYIGGCIYGTSNPFVGDAGVKQTDAGFYVVSRTANNSMTLYKDGSLIDTETATITATQIGYNMFGFCRNIAGTATGLSTEVLRKFIFGHGLDATENVNLNTCITNFNTRLGI